MGITDWLRGLFRRVDDEAERRIAERHQEDRERALRDPFRFDDRTDDFERHRAAHGLSTRHGRWM